MVADIQKPKCFPNFTRINCRLSSLLTSKLDTVPFPFSRVQYGPIALFPKTVEHSSPSPDQNMSSRAPVSFSLRTVAHQFPSPENSRAPDPFS